MIRARTAPALFGIVLYDGVEPIDVGATFGVLSMACRVLSGIRATTLAARPGPVNLAGGLVVDAAHGLDNHPKLDVAIVTGGAGWPQASRDPAMLAFLRRMPAPILASVCTGALLLQAAGMLTRLATTRRTALGTETVSPLAWLGQSGTEALIVDEGDIVTGGGVSLATDTTLHLIGRLYGSGAADDVARAIEYDRAWAANRAVLPTLRRAEEYVG